MPDRASVDVDVDGHLYGRIRRGAESSMDFTGWLGLLSSLDQLIGDAERARNPGSPLGGTDTVPGSALARG